MNRFIFRIYQLILLSFCTLSLTVAAQVETNKEDSKGKAEAVIKKAIQNLGGEKYLQVKTQVGRGKFSILREGGILSFQSFVDVIVFPDKERTDFKGGGSHSIQVNTGNTGWVYDGDQELIKIQNERQVADFKQQHQDEYRQLASRPLEKRG